MVLIDSFIIILAKSVDCQGNNIMHNIMVQTVPTSITFDIDAMYRQCVSFHENKVLSE